MESRILIKADSRFSINRKKIRELVTSILKENNIEAEVEISISVVGDRKMKSLNQKHCQKEKTTSVLSFPLESASEDSGLGFAESPDKILRLGDIVISYPQALKQAVGKNILVDEEIGTLVRHGMKNLLGVNVLS